jgi:Nucleotidyl transferase AbiEii toxin, Type IV TA system
MKAFAPRLDVLPDEQRRLWPELAAVPTEFVLYGGTALALRLGHRPSVDFDFFSSEPFHPAALEIRLPFFDQAQVAQRQENTLTFHTTRGHPVKLSFFGGLSLGRVGEPETTSDGVVAVASLLDIGGTKMATVQTRAEAKDYRDICGLLRAGLPLSQLLAAGQALYGESFNPLITLKALSYFGDGDLGELSASERSTLLTAVQNVGAIPELPRIASKLSARTK